MTSLTDKLNEMTLHDDTGDAFDNGYMAAVEELREWARQHDEAAGDPAREQRLADAMQSIARPNRIGQGCLDGRTWVSLVQTTARGALEPEYVADGSWSWNDDGPIRPGEPGTPVPGSMAALVAARAAG